MLVIRSKRVDLESIGIYAGRLQLDPGARLHVACQQAEYDIVALLEGIENLGNTIERADVEPAALRSFAETIEINFDELLHPRIDVRVGVSFHLHHLPHHPPTV